MPFHNRHFTSGREASQILQTPHEKIGLHNGRRRTLRKPVESSWFYFKEKDQRMKNQSNGVLLTVIALGLLAYHAWVIADDVQAVIKDPNQANKPGEILKLAFDLTRYLR
jgi:hypothetical protein